MKSVWAWSVAAPLESFSRSNSEEYQPMWYSLFRRLRYSLVGSQEREAVPREECCAHSASFTGISR